MGISKGLSSKHVLVEVLTKMEAMMLSVQVLPMKALPVQVLKEALLLAQKQEVCWLVTVWKKNHWS